MPKEYFFRIPDDQAMMVKLVEAVPADWLWVDGALNAPKSLLASGKVEEHTGFSVERFHSIHPTIIGSYDRKAQRRRYPNLYALTVEQKLPGFVEFCEAGLDATDGGPVNFEIARRIACGLLAKGYRGWLTFYKDCYRNHKHDNPARCNMSFEPTVGAPFLRDEAGPQPARVKIEWEKLNCGKEEDIAPILAVCRAHQLHEYVPGADPLGKPPRAGYMEEHE